MNPHIRRTSLCLLVVWLVGPLLGSGRLAIAQETPVSASSRSVRGAMLDASQITESRLQSLQQAGTNTIVIPLGATTEAAPGVLQDAARRVRGGGLQLYYWIEIARCPELADAHPEWMASLQGHDEWRRWYPDTPQPDDDQVVKVYPWVPILYREAFEAHLQRVGGTLATAPPCDGVYLNDLQGAPSACGCGNTLCRWTADYGPKRTASPAPADAAARFVATVKQRFPNLSVIPVWLTECEEHDGTDDGACAGVGCFRGICWQAYTEQLIPVAQQNERLAVLSTYVELRRDLATYPQPAGWIGAVIESFQTMPPKHKGTAIPASRLISVLQGWGVDESIVHAQVEHSAGRRCVRLCRRILGCRSKLATTFGALEIIVLVIRIQ